ncbi:MAG: extracellular solute-binding protein [Eubacterium sp.]|nr:extracellular solute-binding protein [Eubacterium sp.]
MRRKNITKTVKKTIATVLSVAMVAAIVGQNSGSGTVNAETASGSAADATTQQSSSAYEKEEYSSERIGTNYTKVSSKYTLSDYKGEPISYDIEKAADADAKAKLTDETKDYAGSAKVLKVSNGDKFNLKINVKEDGLYVMDFDYLSYDESILPIAMAMQVDGEYPFYETRNIKLATTWNLAKEKNYDRYGNEVVAVPEKDIRWENRAIYDASYRHSDPLKLQLKKGEHTLSFEVKEGNFLLGNVGLSAAEEVEAYKGSEKADGDAIIEIQGEEYAETNDSSIHAIAEYDTSLDPYTTTDTVLNTLDSDSFNEAGQRVTYSFNVEKAGYYNIAANYRQSDKTDFPVFVDVAIDGKIPNEAFRSYSMEYTTKYKKSTMTDSEGKNLTVYLDAGEHTLSYTLSMDNICYIMEALDEIMSEVNDLALEITKVAGSNSDKYRDLKLSRYIPNLEETLQGYADRLKELEQSAVKWSDSDKSVAVMASMLVAANQLESLAENPDEIPYRISELSTSTNSVNHYLAQAIDDLIVNGLAIDRIWIYQDGASLPKKPNIFKSAWMNVKRFTSSFTDQAYSTRNTDSSHLQVWVNRSSQYVQIMQKLIDEKFTPETGIQVDISIMPDQQKLVLANSAGNAPDVATGINYTIPYELAIRGALADMTQFEDFKKTANQYEPGFFLTGTIGDKVYSMPETMNFWVMYYRSDVMEKLGLKLPETMDDVIDMLPDLQMRGLNFYYPTAGMLLMRNFHGTTPLLVQNGGSLYNATANEGCALGKEETVKGFTTLTDLFTVYDMPVNVDNFYQHFRNGDLPIGIADYATYNMLTNAAPELASSWEIALAPGTKQEDGTIDRSVCGCAESSVIFKNDDKDREKKAWEFVKWWSSTETQAEFGQTIQISYGDDYIWPTANMAALDQLPIDSNSKSVIEETAKNVVDVARVPGTYLLERELSNAFNNIVADGQDERTRVDKAVKNVDHEFERKLKEFGYTDSKGNTIKEYNIPTIDSVKKLLAE